MIWIALISVESRKKEEIFAVHTKRENEICIIRLTIPALSHKKVLRPFMLSNKRRKKDENMYEN